MNDEDLKLIFVHKVGYNSEDDALYRFYFSQNETNIDIEGWCWDLCPACDNALPPTEDYYNLTVNLRTNSFDLFCLHEAVDREYMHGYHTIHALAYEVEKQDRNGYSSYDKLMEDKKDLPLLVFHYGITLKNVKDLLYERNILFKNKEFIEACKIQLV
jgi:hypothetical protein